MVIAALIGVGSYLLGSIPFGYLAGRLAGRDVRAAGSGNIGATNVVRVLGRRYGYAVFGLDFGKGFVAVRIAIALATRVRPEWPSAEILGIVAAVCSVIGHSFPPWLKFKGGKGVATSAGALFALMPLAMAIGAAVWVLVFCTTKFVSAASIATAAALPLIILVLIPRDEPCGKPLFYCSLCLAAVIVWRHRSNLSRLLHGSEPRFNRK
jgi:acyl phosphate:glycerol-3-phosphate acyltransferase